MIKTKKEILKEIEDWKNSHPTINNLESLHLSENKKNELFIKCINKVKSERNDKGIN